MSDEHTPASQEDQQLFKYPDDWTDEDSEAEWQAEQEANEGDDQDDSVLPE